MSTSYKDYEKDPKILHAKINVELTAGDTVKIGYYTPTATSIAYWSGAREDRDGDSTYKWIKVTLPYDTTVAGTWRLHSYVELSGMSSNEGVHGSIKN